MPDRLVYLAGAASRTGDARRLMAGLLHYLGAQAGLEDQHAASYRATSEGKPLPYVQSDTHASLTESVRAIQRILGYQRHQVGIAGRLHLLGWSLGGVVLFEAAGRLVEADPNWSDAFGSIVTLSSPINGCDVDGIQALGDVTAGLAGRELCSRASDPAHRAWVIRVAARLRASGVRVLTLGAADDVVVTPADSIVVGPGELASRFTLRPAPRPGSDFGELRLGHGAILHDPVAWRMILAAMTGEEI